MLEKGDRIVHPRHGAGTVSEIRDVEYDGDTRRYYCIELIGDRGTVMVRADQLETIGLRSAEANADMIESIMFKTPKELSSNYRTRQQRLKTKISSNELQEIVQALRDLSWRERKTKLTEADSRLKTRAFRLIVQELALRPSLTLDAARVHLNQIIQKAMQQHEIATGV